MRVFHNLILGYSPDCCVYPGYVPKGSLPYDGLSRLQFGLVQTYKRKLYAPGIYHLNISYNIYKKLQLAKYLYDPHFASELQDFKKITMNNEPYFSN